MLDAKVLLMQLVIESKKRDQLPTHRETHLRIKIRQHRTDDRWLLFAQQQSLESKNKQVAVPLRFCDGRILLAHGDPLF